MLGKSVLLLVRDVLVGKNQDTELLIKPLYKFNPPGRPCKPIKGSNDIPDDNTVTDQSWLGTKESFIEEPIMK